MPGLGTERLDVVVFGATGVVGRLTAQHLARTVPHGARVGLAGRSRDRLEHVRSGLDPRAARWPLLVADSADRASLDRLASSTRVVATTVGPYARHGLPLVEACAAAGTDYCDVTGEVLFVRDCIERAHATAVSTGARVVNACGFDAVPSDLGVLQLHRQVQADAEGELEDVVLVVESLRGGVSGGTIDSVRVQLAAMRSAKDKRRVVMDPYALSPNRDAEPDLGDERDPRGVRRDDGLGGIWTAPFVMATFNTRIVRRSNALQSWAYGRRFRYREVLSTGRGAAAPVLAAVSVVALSGLGAGLALPPTRVLLDRVLPSPGDGPSEKAQRRGRFRMRLHARTSTGARYQCVVAAQADPGYAATSVMLGESAWCLALDDDLPPAAGVLTPATAMGPALIRRLLAQDFEVSVTRL